jgi:hypothetical protein
MSERRVRGRCRQSSRERRTFACLLLIYRNLRKVPPVQRSAQATLHTIKTQHTAAPSAANEATPEVIAEHIELLGGVCVLGTVETVPMRVAHEMPGSNDEVERRGVVPTQNEGS